MALLTIPIALYSLRYTVWGVSAAPEGLGASFSRHPWLIWVHATCGPIALVIGPLQFLQVIRARWPVWHWRMGTIDVLAAAVLGSAGLALAAYSSGGWTTHIGFGALAIGVLITTGAAYVSARRRDFDVHRRWMVRSYALIYAAVMLRLLLPLLVMAMRGDFLDAYRTVSWLCWVPNLIVVEWYLRRRGGRGGDLIGRQRGRLLGSS